jgi:hypothetical protein
MRPTGLFPIVTMIDAIVGRALRSSKTKTDELPQQNLCLIVLRGSDGISDDQSNLSRGGDRIDRGGNNSSDRG